ncbi:MAG: DNA-binding protein [Clostridia bacterium]|nr:DNA-binding protein [Clostridia bacterium]
MLYSYVVIEIFEKNMQIPFLTDIYGELLSERKRELLDYYYNEDYSLSEISEITGISRQGIRDSVKKSEAELLEFEEKLCLLKRIRALESQKSEIINLLTQLQKAE